MSAPYATQSQWVPRPGVQQTPPYHIYNKNIIRSERDERDYRLIRLQNGLQAMLVHDVEADKAAASLDVAVGHLYDPLDMPGLAHFCEHLLFMGTEKFPRENEYSEFLAKNNGASNAFTGTSNTNYYFNVGTPALEGALGRFAAFFYCPLFSPSCTARELNAVDSEHKKNHQSDIWRIFQLNKHLTKDGHSWNKFGTGHRGSLLQAAKDAVRATGSATSSRVPSPTSSTGSSFGDAEDGGPVGRETRRRLIEWWTKEYSANRMRLCVVGKESLDELSDMVSRLFSDIPNRGVDPLPAIPDHPFGSNEKGTMVAVQTIMSFHAVEVSFPLPYQPARWKYKPANFLAHFVGHEGPGSLHSYLKQKGWLTSLSSGPQNLAREFAMFKVTLHLTREGFSNYRDVILAVHKYLSLLRSSEFPPWYQKELSIINATRFRFAEKQRPDDYAVWVSEHLAWPVERDTVLSSAQLVSEWDESGEGEKEVREILNTLTIDEGRAVVMARPDEFERVFGAEGKPLNWESEPWYGTKYLVERFSEDFVSRAREPNDIPGLYLPKRNEFLPENLDVDKLDVTQPARRPHLIRENSLSQLWYKKDDQYWVPKAQVCVDIRSPHANASPKTSVMTRLFADLVGDSLTELSYDADLAGLSYNYASHSFGTYLIIGGYNDKLPVLLHHIFEKIKGLKVKPDRLNVMKEQLKRNWENFFLGQTYQISEYYGKYPLHENLWLLNEKLPEIASVTVEDLQAHAEKFLSDVSLKILVVGNMYKEEATNLAEAVEKLIDPAPAKPSELIDRPRILPPGSNFIWTIPVPNPNEPNSSLTYYVHLGSRNDPRLRIVGSLLAQILSEPAFNVLRTQEQLGYIVACSQWALPGDVYFGIRILVQSERHPTYLEERVEAFLDFIKSKLETMPESEFLEQKTGLERKWREGAKNLVEETNKYWIHIESGIFDFHRRDNDADMLKDVTKEEVLSLFLSNVHRSSSQRAKLSVHCVSRKPRPKKLSSMALLDVDAALEKHGIALPIDWMDRLPEADTITGTLQVLKEIIDDPAAAATVESELSVLAEKYPDDSDRHGVLPAGYIAIEDSKKFRDSLKVAEGAVPLVDWGDLPVSRF
ncbi:hypothetical protein BDM02DRAFT_3183249 [Thelephora ganbajun]|uniref:Uncharacterized protein n=1 Tax=Thelephora ganbajun TaxID=370292 RepID=A0ACB6ZTE0_THEGA|nr:hypothetical protein BDM02DRAFT_3183249 [Thelephora ganbajun]